MDFEFQAYFNNTLRLFENAQTTYSNNHMRNETNPDFEEAGSLSTSLEMRIAAKYS